MQFSEQPVLDNLGKDSLQIAIVLLVYNGLELCSNLSFECHSFEILKPKKRVITKASKEVQLGRHLQYRAVYLKRDWREHSSPSFQGRRTLKLSYTTIRNTERSRECAQQDRLWEMLLKARVHVRYSGKTSHKAELKCLLKYSGNCRDYSGHLMSKISKGKTLRM